MSSVPARPRWHFLVTPKWLGWHAFTVLAVYGMLWLGDWQFRRAEAGNALSWAYTFEWPVFAVFGVGFWVKTIRDEFRPPAHPGEAEELDLPPGAAAGTGPGARPGRQCGAGYLILTLPGRGVPDDPRGGHEAAQPEEGAGAAGRHAPGPDVRGRALGYPPVHQPRPGRLGPGAAPRARSRAAASCAAASRAAASRAAASRAAAAQLATAGGSAVLRRAPGRCPAPGLGARRPARPAPGAGDRFRDVLAVQAGPRDPAAAGDRAPAARRGKPARSRLRLRPPGAGAGGPVS